MPDNAEIARIEERLKAVQEDLAEVKGMINGDQAIPYERSVRGRLHFIEGNLATETMQHEALDAIRAQQRLDAGDKFTRREKIVVACLSLPGAFVSVLIALQMLGVVGRG